MRTALQTRGLHTRRYERMCDAAPLPNAPPHHSGNGSTRLCITGCAWYLLQQRSRRRHGRRAVHVAARSGFSSNHAEGDPQCLNPNAAPLSFHGSKVCRKEEEQRRARESKKPTAVAQHAAARTRERSRRAVRLPSRRTVGERQRGAAQHEYEPRLCRSGPAAVRAWQREAVAYAMRSARRNRAAGGSAGQGRQGDVAAAW